MKAHRLLHETIGEFLERGRHNLNVDGVAALPYRLDCILDVFGEVEQRHFCDALLLCRGVCHTEAKW